MLTDAPDAARRTGFALGFVGFAPRLDWFAYLMQIFRMQCFRQQGFRGRHPSAKLDLGRVIWSSSPAAQNF